MNDPSLSSLPVRMRCVVEPGCGSRTGGRGEIISEHAHRRILSEI